MHDEIIGIHGFVSVLQASPEFRPVKGLMQTVEGMNYVRYL